MLLLVLAACQRTEGTLDMSWNVEPAEVVTGKFLDVELGASGSLVTTCTSRDDTRDVHVVRSESDSATHSTGVFGLLGSSTYDCVLEADAGDGLWARGEFRTSTSRIPKGIEEGVVEGDIDAMSGTWTLFNPFENGKATDDQWLVVIDPEGEIRWYIEVEQELGSVDHSVVDGDILYGGGYDVPGSPRIVTTGQELLYTGPQPVSGGTYHHDVEMTPSGLIAGVVTLEGDDYVGFGVEIRDPDDDGALVWAWDSDSAVERGDLPSPRGDMYHANALEIVEEDGVPRWAYVNIRNLGRYVRIDIEEDVIDWQITAATWELNSDEWWFLSHDPKLEDDLLLVYDNGERNPNSHSRVVEYALDFETETAELLWEWTEPSWREPAWGGVDRLDGDHVLVAIGHCDGSSCDEAHPDSRTRILEVDRATDEVVWAYRYTDEAVGLYRAERIDGCDLFSNARFCPQLLQE